MTTPFAHVAGLPLEETLPALLPAACALALTARATFAQASQQLRRRRPPKRTSKAFLDAAERIGDRHTVRIR